MYILTLTDDAINYAGSQSKLARLLNITRQSVSAWDREVPQASARALYILTNGEIGKMK